MISSTCYQHISKLGFIFTFYHLKLFPDCLFSERVILSVFGKIILACGVLWIHMEHSSAIFPAVRAKYLRVILSFILSLTSPYAHI